MDIKTIKNLLRTINENEQGSTLYEAATKMLHIEIQPLISQLSQLVRYGPVEDGDIESKSARSDLIELGLANRACVKGQQGFTVANYLGWDVLHATSH